MLRTGLILGVALAGGIVMTGTASDSKAAANALDGIWAGDRLRLTMESGSGRIESDCAGGSIAGPVSLGKDGGFSAKGTFEQYRAGPQRADVTAKAHAARFAGQMGEDTMRLSITPAGAKTPQVYNLRKGARMKLFRCL